MTTTIQPESGANAPCHRQDATATGHDVATGVHTAEQVLESHLSRIEQLDGRLGAFVFLDVEAAYDRARSIDERVRAGQAVGPLAGVPFGVKELEEVAGWPHTLASHLLAERVAGATSTQVSRLEQAGAVPVGLTASAEMGAASFTATRLHGVCRNPWSTSHTPGGSSGGSAAAVAAGLVPLATGSDSAGSLRLPAAFSGVVGMKASVGVVPRGPGSSGASRIRHYGTLTRSVRDTAAVLDAVAGIDPGDPATVPAGRSLLGALHADLSGSRVAFSPDLGFATCDPAVADVVAASARVLTAALGGLEAGVTVALPDAALAWEVLLASDLYPLLQQLVPSHGSEMSPWLVRMYDCARSIDADLLTRAYQVREQLEVALSALFEEVDLLVLPTAPTTAFAAEGPMPTVIAGREVDPLGSVALSYPFNLSGHPAISVPAGTLAGLPVGMQIVGRRYEDARVLAAAAAFEAAQPWPALAPEWSS